MFASSSEAFLVVLLSLQVLTLDLRAPQRLSLFKAIKKGSRNVVLQSSTFPSEPVNGVVICHATNRFTWLLDTTRQGTKAHILTDWLWTSRVVSSAREKRVVKIHTHVPYLKVTRKALSCARVLSRIVYLTPKGKTTRNPEETALFKDALIITSSVVRPKSLGVTCRYLYLQGKSPMMSSKSSL